MMRIITSPGEGSHLMSKDLAAQRFAGTPQLEAALDDTTDSHVVFDGGGVLPRANGPHVRALQESLLAMGFPLPEFGADGDFGLETKVAVSMFQIDAGLERRPDLPDQMELIDGKVGRDTMGLFDMFDPGPTVGSFTSVQTGVPAASVAFAESPEELFAGFDDPTGSLVVGTRSRRQVQVQLDPVDAEVEYTVDDPATASVALTADGIVVTGEAAGTTLVRARSFGEVMALLDVVVKDERAETVNFFFVMDSANPAHASNRVVSQAGALTSRLNRVWRRQANVHFTLGQATEIVVPIDLGDVVDAHDLAHFADFGVPGELNIFFVWEFEPIPFDQIPGFPIIDVDGTTAVPDDPAFPTNVFLDDDDCADLLTVAHEAGHYLGFRSAQHPPTGIMSVCHGGVDRPRVPRALADLVNP
jgi:hypothetical protein